jgi:hypothetical protein
MVASSRSTEKTCGRPQITGKNRFGRFYVHLLWGSRPEAKNWRSYCPLGSRKSYCFLQGAYRIQLHSGVGIPDISQKVEPRTGYQINLRSEAIGKKIFTSMEEKFYES